MACLTARRAVPGFVCALSLLLPACGPSPDVPLPPENDLYIYSLAVAERARLKSEQSTRGLFYVGRVHQRFGREDKALDEFRQVTQLEPDFGEAYRRIGYILSQRQDKMGEAVEAYQQSMRCEPGIKGVSTRIGLILMHQGKLEEAVDILGSEIRAGTADAETYYHLGQAHSLRGDHSSAVENYREAARRNPLLRSAYYSLAQSLRALGESREAEDAQKRFRDLKAKEDAENAAEKDNRSEQVRFASEVWVDAAELFTRAHNATKDAEHRAVLLKEFLTALGEAIRIDPTYVEPRMILLDHWGKRKDSAGLLQTAKDALRALPREPMIAEAVYQAAGEALEEAGGSPSAASVETALALLQGVATANAEHADAHREIAKLILFRKRDQPDLLPSAFEHARQAVNLEPTARNYDTFAYACFRLGKKEEACKVLEEGLLKNPGDEKLEERLRACRQP